MSLGRREFLTWTGLTALGAAALVATGCAGRSPAPTSGGTRDLLKIGLYSWDEITYLPTQIRWLGLSYARIGGVMSDSIMTFCANNNIEVLLNVSPATARSSFSTDADFIAAYLAQIDTALNKYGPQGTFWKANPTLPNKPVAQIEVCNEPNTPGYGFIGTRAEIAGLYAQVLIAAYNHIKATWPAVTVVGFATSGASNAAPDFVSAVMTALQDAGQVNCFDVMSIHPYSSDQPPEQVITESWGTWVASESMHTVRQLMPKFGVDKPLWITEFGYQISHAEGGKFAAPSIDASGNPETVTPAQQAAYTIRMNMASARYGINRVYHMSALDTDNCNSGWFGPDPNHDPRPVATAMRQVIRLLSGATYLEIVYDGGIASPGSPYAYRFSTPHGRVMVAWCQIPTNVTLPIDPSTQTVVTDMLGNTITTLTGGSYLASLSETPIFLHSRSSPTPSSSLTSWRPL